jgi:type I restriction enzyme R subunit
LYRLKGKCVVGFNSIFAVSSIEVEKLYYAEFRKETVTLPLSVRELKIILICSFVVNELKKNGCIST